MSKNEYPEYRPNENPSSLKNFLILYLFSSLMCGNEELLRTGITTFNLEVDKQYRLGVWDCFCSLSDEKNKYIE